MISNPAQSTPLNSPMVSPIATVLDRVADFLTGERGE